MNKVVSNQRLVLEAPYPTMTLSPKLQAALDKVQQEVKQGQVSKPYTDVDELMANLKS